MQGNEETDELFAVLLMYDRSWIILYSGNDQTILCNASGCEARGLTLFAAIQSALQVQAVLLEAHQQLLRITNDSCRY